MREVEVVSNAPGIITLTVVERVVGGHVSSRRVCALPVSLLRTPIVQSAQSGSGADVAIGLAPVRVHGFGWVAGFLSPLSAKANFDTNKAFLTDPPGRPKCHIGAAARTTS